jgi:hypothetical protein
MGTMDAVAVILIGIGVFLVYEAYKSPTPTPVKTATGVLNNQASA